MTANDYEELITYLRQNGEFKRQKEIKSWTIYLNTSKEEFYKKIKKPNIRKIGYNDFEYLNIIGKGSFGTILLGKNKITKEYFAIKVVDKKTKFSRVGNEVKILSGIHCPFIVEMFTYFEYKNSLYLILQLIPGGDLSSLLDRFGRLDESVSRFYAAQVLLAVEYLHCLDIVYRDIKPENILMDASGYIKLTDLGLSKHLKKGRTYTFCGTPEYIAPEVILSKGYGKSIDYWAFGILLFELNSGKTPFYTKSHYYTFAKISDGNYKMATFFSDHLKDLIFKLLQKDISNRLGVLKNGINDIKNHIWFDNTVWLELANKKQFPPFAPTATEIKEKLFKTSSFRGSN